MNAGHAGDTCIACFVFGCGSGGEALDCCSACSLGSEHSLLEFLAFLTFSDQKDEDPPTNDGVGFGQRSGITTVVSCSRWAGIIVGCTRACGRWKPEPAYR